jgi:predicted SPOUT superfamily RNA methylase MTH1
VLFPSTSINVIENLSDETMMVWIVQRCYVRDL